MTYEQVEQIKAESAKLAKGIIEYVMLDVKDLAIDSNINGFIKLIEDSASKIKQIAE